jgi:hypothetical protein
MRLRATVYAEPSSEEERTALNAALPRRLNKVKPLHTGTPHRAVPQRSCWSAL